MRKLFYLGFCLVLATGVGCAISNYELITDNDQGNGTADPQFTVNTNGKAHIMESAQVAVVYADFSDETLWFVDQKANGDRVLTTHNNLTSAAGFPNYWHDDLYCNPDWNGCASVTSQDPEVGDVDIYDYSGNPNCAGYRSLYYLTSTTRYYGECGRIALGLADRLSFINMGEPTNLGSQAALRWVGSPMNTSIFMDNLAGTKVNIPVTGSFSLTLSGGARRTGILDMSNPSLKVMSDYMANFYENYGSQVNHVDVVYNGLTFSKNFGVVDDIAKKVRARANNRY